MSYKRERPFRITFVFLFVIFSCCLSLVTVLVTYGLLTSAPSCPEAPIAHSEFLAPKEEKPLHKLAVLVPYRDRFEELLQFAPYMHSFLKAQRIAHDIFVLNQVDGYRFNRASLINVGYLETKGDHDYIAMHDVDLLPLNHNLSYGYPKRPMHLAAPHLHPRYHYEKFIGGILLINREHFGLVNGLSNNYWGWGLEDDEFYVRLRDASLNITRPEHIATGMNDTFSHIHDKKRKRDTVKCYNQREVTRRRDRKTGLNDVKYSIAKRTRMKIEDADVMVVNIELSCDLTATPWCDCTESEKKKKKTTTVK